MSSDMREYTITVMARDNSDQSSDARISAVVRLNDGSEPHIVELTVRMSERGGSLPYAVRDIDFERLSKALLSTVSASVRMTEAPTSRREEKRVQAPRAVRGDTNQRPYRKMPPVDDVKAVFLETGSVGKLAKHFDVPRYTAQAWIDRLRRIGQLGPRIAG